MKALGVAVGVTALAVAGVAWLFLRDRPSVPIAPPVPPSVMQPPAATEADLAAIHAAVLPDLEGRPQAMQQWRGKLLVLNYWATWCNPCREEMPLLSRLHERYSSRGVQFVGIAAEEVASVREFVRRLPVSYPLLAGGDAAADGTRAFGNVPLALPFTLVLDREGAVRATIRGRVREEALVKLLDRL